MNPWQLVDSHAKLQANSLQAQVDLSNPAGGLQQLSWNGAALTGQLLGLTVATQSLEPTSLNTEGLDKFVRGSDLVANYPQIEAQPFTLHMYWRIVSADSLCVIVDGIVSLQTSLLECFPKAVLTSELPAGEVLQVHGDGTPAASIDAIISSDRFAGVLVRDAARKWSYLEATYPEDLGTWHVEPGQQQVVINRELGGEFQEKGVIRRLRVRNAFLPYADDVARAAQLLKEFAASPPPLTA
jgi:hypothetical protein